MNRFIYYPVSRPHPVAHHRIYAMVASSEASQLHLLATFNLFGIAISPLNRHVGIRVGIHKHIESARFGKFGQESD